jgi:soluble lytic murein transglycosylase
VPPVSRHVSLSFATCLALVASHADARPSHADQSTQKDAIDPAKLLDPVTAPAGSTSLLPLSARRYGQAKKLLARGKPSQALAALKGSRAQLLQDREALLRGDALLALGNKQQAKEAYLAALTTAQIKSVAIGAVRGLIDVLGQTGERDQQLVYLDALLAQSNVPRRANLLLQKAELLNALERKDEAAAICWRMFLDFPSAPATRKAMQLLERLKQKGIKTPSTPFNLELLRIKNLIASSSFNEADRAMNALLKKAPGLAVEIELERAEIHKKKREKGLEQQVLERLIVQKKVSGAVEAKLLSRLGRIAMSRDENEQALDYFDRLRAKFPSDRDAIEGQYLAGWILYDGGDFDASSRRMLEFAEEHPRASRRTEALWFAGWASYLAKQDGAARRAFTQLLEDHPGSSLGPQVHYWLGRIDQRANDLDKAREEYREVLKLAPLSYYGFWAMERLRQLGEETVLTPPPPEAPPASIAKVVELLGGSRPVLIDRAVALHAAGLQSEALEELTASASYLRQGRDTKGRTMVADLLHRLGAHHLAFRIAMGIAADGADLVSGAPWAWRAWRHAYPRAFEQEVAGASKAHQVDDELILSIMRTESHFRPAVTSFAGARGLMQLMPATAEQIGRRAKGAKVHSARFREPRSNVWLGTWYLGSLLARYGNNVGMAAGAYNAGPGAMDSWVEAHQGLPMDEFVERIPYRETRRYVRRVVETYLVYQRLAGKQLPRLDGKVEKVSAREADGVTF